MEISVIVPTLNEGGYLRRALESLRKQTFDDFEIIIVDGNSSDATVDVAKEYTDRVFVLKKRGVPIARNYGAKKSRGRITAHTDADCLMPPQWLERMYDDFEKKDVEMVWGPVYYDEEASLLGKIHLNTFWMLQRYTWKFAPYTFNPNLAFTKEGFEKIGRYREDISFMDDYDIGRRGIKNLRYLFDPDNSVIFSGRRYRSSITVITELMKYLKGFFQYHLTDSISEKFIPSNLLTDKTSKGQIR